MASDSDFYPASGRRTSDTGGLYNVGAYGGAWSSSTNAAWGVHGSLLIFFSTNVHPESGDSREYGFPVRCVQE